MISSNPFLRSLAGAEPTVPCSSTMFTSSVASLKFSLTQRPALRPSSTKSEPEEADVQRRIAGDRAVGEDHGNAGGLGFLQHRVPAGFDHRRERDHVHLLRDERAQRLDLVFLLLLRVGEAQVDVHGGGGGLDRLGVRRAPFALGADLAEAEHDALVFLFARAAREQQGRPARAISDVPS